VLPMSHTAQSSPWVMATALYIAQPCHARV